MPKTNQWRKVQTVVVMLIAITLIISGSMFLNGSSYKVKASNNGLARTPPMGFNTWNKYNCDGYNAKTIENIANMMVSNGMKAAGYQYVNLDDCWQLANRDGNGNLIPDPTKFNNIGITLPQLISYVHGKGLKIGLYTDAGTNTCAGRAGLAGHDQQDANQYAAWGIDYLKVDWCNNNGMDPQTRYTQFRDALNKAGAGGKIVYSLCNWGVNSPWNWGPSIGNLWRTTGDIADTWGTVIGNNMYQNSFHASSAGPGGWNDPDMLEVGNGGMTTTEDTTHFSMWAEMAAPLITGNDITNMSSATANILENKEVIAVDQDTYGAQGILVWDNSTGLNVWSKPLNGGARAVVLLNLSANSANITANWSNIGVSGNATVRDLWAHQDRGSYNGSYTANVPSHGAVMLKISGNPVSLNPSLGTWILCANENNTCNFSGTAVVRYGAAIYKVGTFTNGVGCNNTAFGGDPLPFAGKHCDYQPNGSGGTYNKISNRASGLALDNPNGSTATGTIIDQWTWDTGSNQQWALINLNNGYYVIQNRASGLVLDNPNGSTATGTKIDQWTRDTGNNQQWALINLGNGYYEIQNRASGLVLDNPNGSTATGTQMEQWTWKNGTNQHWAITGL